MKPQCTTTSQCLKELARVMEQFGIGYIEEALKSRYVKRFYKGRNFEKTVDALVCPTEWQFAIAEVEGKPVFIGDELYIHGLGSFDGRVTASDKLFTQVSTSHLSWNPPKPKTVMVELTVDDAEQWAGLKNVPTSTRIYDDLASSCKLALEKMK